MELRVLGRQEANLLYIMSLGLTWTIRSFLKLGMVVQIYRLNTQEAKARKIVKSSRIARNTNRDHVLKESKVIEEEKTKI